ADWQPHVGRLLVGDCVCHECVQPSIILMSGEWWESLWCRGFQTSTPAPTPVVSRSPDLDTRADRRSPLQAAPRRPAVEAVAESGDPATTGLYHSLLTISHLPKVGPAGRADKSTKPTTPGALDWPSVFA